VKDDEGKVTRLDFRGEIRGKSDADLAAASS